MSKMVSGMILLLATALWFVPLVAQDVEQPRNLEIYNPRYPDRLCPPEYRGPREKIEGLMRADHMGGRLKVLFGDAAPSSMADVKVLTDAEDADVCYIFSRRLEKVINRQVRLFDDGDAYYLHDVTFYKSGDFYFAAIGAGYLIDEDPHGSGEALRFGSRKPNGVHIFDKKDLEFVDWWDRPIEGLQIKSAESDVVDSEGSSQYTLGQQESLCPAESENTRNLIRAFVDNEGLIVRLQELYLLDAPVFIEDMKVLNTHDNSEACQNLLERIELRDRFDLRSDFEVTFGVGNRVSENTDLQRLYEITFYKGGDYYFVAKWFRRLTQESAERPGETRALGIGLHTGTHGEVTVFRNDFVPRGHEAIKLPPRL